VGVFDEDYFLYFEEVDLFKRMAASGWESWYVPDLRMIHHVGASTGISDYRRQPSTLPNYWYESRSNYFRKQHGTLSSLGIDFSWLAGRGIHLFSRILLRRENSSAVEASRINVSNPWIRKGYSAILWPDMNDQNEDSRFVIATRQAFWNRVQESWKAHGRKFSSPGFKTVVVHGFGQWRMSIRWKWLRALMGVLYRILYRRCCVRYGIELPYGVKLGERVIFEHQNCIVIHGNSVIDDDSIIRHGVTLGNRYQDRLDEAPVLGKRVSVGTGAVILGKVTLGDDVQVGANAVVLEAVLPGCTVVGVPAGSGRTKTRRPRPPLESPRVPL
jgi:serine O-acetyltransferase